jgi:hypothetical protein
VIDTVFSSILLLSIIILSIAVLVSTFNIL